jgi:hypothetical protein
MIGALLLAMPLAAQAGPLEGAAIGAGTGAIVGGPPGAAVGGVIGAVVGGPNVVSRPRYYRGRHYARGHRSCWRDSRGYRHCGYR